MKIIPSLVLLFMASSVFSQDGWILRNRKIPPDVRFDQIRILDPQNIWITGKFIYKSANAGSTWIDMNPHPDSLGIPISSDEIWALAALNNNEVLVATGVGSIYRTSNGGSMWTKVFDSSPDTLMLDDMEMFDDSLGYAIGDAPNSSALPKFIITTNGGRTWQTIVTNLPVGASSAPRRTDFVSSKTGWSCFKSSVYKTIDGGFTWTKIVDNLLLDRLFFMDDSVGFYTLNGGSVLTKSTDGGMTWNQKISIAPKGFEFIRWSPAKNLLWAGGGNFVYRSLDKGETWMPQIVPSTMPTGTYFYDAFFLNDSIGVVAGRSTVLYTTTGGQPLVSVSERGFNSSPSQSVILKNYPNPFNSSTMIRFDAPDFDHVRISIYDLLGKEISVLMDEIKTPGKSTVSWDASTFTSGVYIARIQSGSSIQTRKIVFVR